MGSTHLVDLFWQFYHDHPSIVITNLLFLFIIPVSDILLPHLYGKIMDAMRQNTANVFTPFLHVIIVLAVVHILFLLSDYHDAKLMPNIQCYIREKIVDRILENYEQQHTELELGNIITKIVKLPHVMVEWFARMKNYVIPYVIVFILATLYFTYNDIQLGVSLFFVLLIFTLLIILSPFTCAKVSFDRDKCFNEIHENIDDLLRNLFSVYGSNQKKEELKRLAKFTNIHNSLYEDTIKCVLKLKFWVTPLVILYLVFFIYRSYKLINMKRMDPSKFVSLFIILLYVLSSMIVLNDQINDIIIEWGIIESSSDIIAKIPLKTTLNSQLPFPSSGIGLSHVSFAYPGNNKLTLDDVSLHIGDGERVCITGDIGSGKSTVIKLLLKYNIPDSGTIYWNGRNYNDISIQELRSKIGYVPQHPVLFNRSILDNILYGNTTYQRADVEAILTAFNIKPEFDKFEKGLDTIIGKNGSKLSGGQRQLVWCLRVLLSNPEIIILDEPTASIDEKTKATLHNMLNILMKDKTVIMVTHDPFLVKIATRNIDMKNGSLIIQ